MVLQDTRDKLMIARQIWGGIFDDGMVSCEFHKKEAVW